MNELNKDVHVWRVRVSQHLGDVDSLKKLLSVEEQGKAARFVTEQLSLHYVVAHGFLRKILVDYVQEAPEKLQFLKGPHGTPYFNDRNIFFNMSHAADYVLYARTCVGEVGIDVEATDRTVDYLGLAKRFFTEGEYEELSVLEGGALQNTFFTYWTRKEAYLKMLGKGLVQPLSSVDVRNNLIDEKGCFQISDIDVANGYFASLAYPRVVPAIQVFEL